MFSKRLFCFKSFNIENETKQNESKKIKKCPTLIIVMMKQFENENCSTDVIKKWVIFAKLVPLSISKDETI